MHLKCALQWYCQSGGWGTSLAVFPVSVLVHGLFFFQQNKISPRGNKNGTKFWQKVKKSSRFEAVGRVVVEVLPHLRVDVLTYIQYFNIRKIQVTDSILND